MQQKNFIPFLLLMLLVLFGWTQLQNWIWPPRQKPKAVAPAVELRELARVSVDAGGAVAGWDPASQLAVDTAVGLATEAGLMYRPEKPKTVRLPAPVLWGGLPSQLQAVLGGASGVPGAAEAWRVAAAAGVV